MSTLPTNIDIAKAKLPAAYEQAKAALESCVKVDECKTWANKAAALATYAKMADDDSLLTLANRIQVRAVSRMGELLKQFNNGPGRPKDENRGSGPPISQAEAGRKAGLSPDQIKQAVRIANIPADKFESLVESDNPPTVTALAEMGKQVRAMPKPPISKAAQARLDGFFGQAGGLAWSLDFLERDKPKAFALIVQELIDNPVERKNIEALRTRLGRLLGMAKAQETQSPSTVPPATLRAEMPDIPACLDRRPKAQAIAAAEESERALLTEWANEERRSWRPSAEPLVWKTIGKPLQFDGVEYDTPEAVTGAGTYYTSVRTSFPDMKFSGYSVSFSPVGSKPENDDHLGDRRTLEEAKALAQRHAEQIGAGREKTAVH